MENTQDLSKFGYRELDMAGNLLKAYANQSFASQNDHLEDGIKLEFNPYSGEVFLVDEDYNMAILSSNNSLENWLTCSNCGDEGLRSEIEFFDDSTCIKCHEEEKKNN